MKIVEHRILFDSGDKFTLRHLTDLHLGHALCDEKMFDRDVAAIAADPFGMWLGGGDYADFINRKDPRHKESSLAKWLHGKDDIAKLQSERVLKSLVPIGGKCIGLICGNHEASILDHYERDVYGELVSGITCPERKIRLGVEGFVILRWIDKKCKKTCATTTIFAHHGNGGGAMEGGDALMLGRLPKSYSFDLAMIGHRHKKHLLPGYITGPSHDGKRVVGHDQFMFIGGTYLSGFDTDPNSDVESYAEFKMLPPRGVGTVYVEFYPTTEGCTFKVIL